MVVSALCESIKSIKCQSREVSLKYQEAKTQTLDILPELLKSKSIAIKGRSLRMAMRPIKSRCGRLKPEIFLRVQCLLLCKSKILQASILIY